MRFSSYRPPRALRILFVGLVVLSCVLLMAYLAQFGGDGTTRVTDFSLCNAANQVDDTPTVLESVVVSPTSVVYVCGYLSMEIKNPAARNVCLAFYLTRDGRLIYSRDYCRDTAGYFVVPIETDDLFSPGQYSIRVIDGTRRNWDEMITFTVQR